MNETNLLRQILLDVTKSVKGCRLFRNNTGVGWQGDCKRLEGKIIIYDPRPLEAGLCPGSSDLIGWTPVTITPDLVGKQLAIFTAVEIKTPTGRMSEKQLHFIQAVRAAGGFGHIARSSEQAVGFLSNPPLQQISQQ